MKHLLPKALLVALPLLALTPTVYADEQLDASKSRLCNPGLQAEMETQSNDNCLNYINGYLNGLIAAQKQNVLDERLEHQLNEANGFSDFEKRAFTTRVGTYPHQLKPNKSADICALQSEKRRTYINQMADDLDYTGSKRQDYILSINNMLARGNIC